MGIQVTVINDHHIAGWIGGALHRGEIYMNCVRSMVDNVLAHLAYEARRGPESPESIVGHLESCRFCRSVPGPLRPFAFYGHVVSDIAGHRPSPRPAPKKISRLNIIDHGYEDEDGDPHYAGVDIGSDYIDTTSFNSYRSQLSRLGPHFDSDGFVHIENCHVGRDVRLLEMFSDAFGVPVVGARSYGHSGFPTNLGRYIRAFPMVNGGRRLHESFFWRSSAYCPTVKSHSGAAAHRETAPRPVIGGLRRIRPH